MFQIFTDTKSQFVAIAASLYCLSGCYIYQSLSEADLSRIWIYQVCLVSLEFDILQHDLYSLDHYGAQDGWG